MNEVTLQFSNADFEALEPIRVRLGFPSIHDLVGYLVEVGYNTLEGSYEPRTIENVVGIPEGGGVGGGVARATFANGVNIAGTTTITAVDWD